MAGNLVGQLIDEAIDTNGTYAEFIVSSGNIAFICDGGTRKSTRNIKAEEKQLMQMQN